MPQISLIRPDLSALGTLWRELEQRSDGSFFQGWNWVGCLAERRFPDPVLMQAHEEGRLVALALFNRRRSAAGPETLWLGESGSPALDAVFTEHNGILTERGQGAALVASCLRACLREKLTGRSAARRLVLGGVDTVHLDAACAQPGMALHRHVPRPAPFVDLSRIGDAGFVAGLSANARHQIRRSGRLYAGDGTLEITHATAPEQALQFLDALATLHQASWQRRGKPGAFANPDFCAFHRALVMRAFGDGEVDLLRIAAAGRDVGYLYNFRKRNHVYAYQSGFAYTDDPHRKPGLTCHSLAIDMYAAEGAAVYDFLAGGDRYKTTLANGGTTLHWAELSPWWWPQALAARARALAGNR
jgi:CelD/BcsL family acetyltransferase involved in cellulose biosynthesis